MKFGNRMLALLTGAMLTLNSISAASLFATDGDAEKLAAAKKAGMTKIYSFEFAELQKWREENAGLLSGTEQSEENDPPLSIKCCSESYSVPVNELEGHSLLVYVELKNVPDSSLSDLFISCYETWEATEREIKAEDGKLQINQKKMSADLKRTMKYEKDHPMLFGLGLRNSYSEELKEIRFDLGGEIQPPSDFDAEISVYGKKKTDKPDPSLSEITGTTTGTAVAGEYTPEYQPWISDENGSYYFCGTNDYQSSALRILQYPKREYAVGEPLSTEGLKVSLTEYRLFNQCEADVSDCLQIMTDYDPDTPGEYIVYIRTDYIRNMFRCNDYLFYTVRVDENLTTAETTETTESLSQPEHTAIRGDVDCSGTVQIADAVLLARYIAEDAVTVTAQGLFNAELDGEAGLTAGDLSVLLQAIAGSTSLA